MNEPRPTPQGALLGSADHPVVIVRRRLRATPADVWDAWTDPERLVRWLGAVDGALTTPGDTVNVAMAATELPADPTAVENPARFTVRAAVPPTRDTDGRLEFVFDDRADPGGIVTVTMAADGDDGCLMVLRHVLADKATALEHSAGFGAGWEGFFDWLEDALAGRDHGPDASYEALLPAYEAARDRLSVVRDGSVEETDATATVRHERLLAAPIEQVWSLLTTSDGLATWLGRVTEGAFGDGARVTIRHGESPTDDQVQRSLVTAWEPPTHLAMTWEFTGEPTSSVEIVLRAEDTPTGGRTHLVLVHRELAAMVEEYLAGWHAHLDVVTAIAEGRPPVTWQDAFDAASAISAVVTATRPA